MTYLDLIADLQDEAYAADDFDTRRDCQIIMDQHHYKSMDLALARLHDGAWGDSPAGVWLTDMYQNRLAEIEWDDLLEIEIKGEYDDVS